MGRAHRSMLLFRIEYASLPPAVSDGLASMPAPKVNLRGVPAALPPGGTEICQTLVLSPSVAANSTPLSGPVHAAGVKYVSGQAARPCRLSKALAPVAMAGPPSTRMVYQSTSFPASRAPRNSKY